MSTRRVGCGVWGCVPCPSLKPSPELLNVIHATCYTTSSYIIHFECASNSGEARRHYHDGIAIEVNFVARKPDIPRWIEARRLVDVFCTAPPAPANETVTRMVKAALTSAPWNYVLRCSAPQGLENRKSKFVMSGVAFRETSSRSVTKEF